MYIESDLRDFFDALVMSIPIFDTIQDKGNQIIYTP